jgi:hypothetical protein
MKGIINKFLFAVAFLSLGSKITAYTWEFSNHTDKIDKAMTEELNDAQKKILEEHSKPFAKSLEIQLNLAAGPSGSCYVDPGYSQTISWESGWYIWFCMSSIKYCIVPKRKQWDHAENVPRAWTEVNVVWVDNNGVQAIEAALGKFGSSLQAAAEAVVSTAGAIETGGASTMASQAEAGLGDNAKKLAATKKANKGEALNSISDAVGKADVGGLFSSITSMVSHSNCRGRHYDIYNKRTDLENDVEFFTIAE